MFEISRDTMISEILANAPEAMPVFQNIGMHCLGCAMASGETLEQACLAPVSYTHLTLPTILTV